MIKGIKGLTPREPIGVVATIGHKGGKGQPVDTDRFYLVLPTAEKVGNIEARRPHPSFRGFNEIGAKEDADEGKARRQVVAGQLVHVSVSECWEHHLTAQVLPGLQAHPARAPHCTGDGTRARRWNGQAYQEIVCPNELCQYRQGDRKACGAWGRVLFRLRWKDGSPLPGLLCKLTTKSWNSVAAFLGFFEEVERQAQILGGQLGVYGVPFVITLGRKSIPSRQRSFPVMNISVDGDLQLFFVERAGRLRQALEEVRRPVAALTDGEQQRDQEVALDIETITPPRLPMVTEEA